MRNTLLLGATLALLIACQALAEPGEASPKASAGDGRVPAAITAEGLARHIRTLAGDPFSGRQPGTEGERLTVDYLVAAFREAGLSPGNDDAFTQAVPYVQITTIGQPELRIHGADGSRSAKTPDDFVIGSRTGQAQVAIRDASLVFAGYGVVAPEQGWNDYADLDAAGKAVVVLVNDPGFGSSVSDRFKGREMTYYGRWTYKYEECARQRAAACLIVHDDAGASYGWNVVQSSFGARAQFDLDGGDEGRGDTVPVVGWVSTEAARALFARAGQDFDTLKQAAHEPGFRAVPLADLKLDAKVESTIERGTSDNVVAALIGHERPDEWVVVTAHWDHLGTTPREDGGVDIYNGAINNAAGLAAMIEMARALKQGGGTARSVLFLPVTLEESGLIGSRYYAAHPVVPLAQTVANVNIDALLPVAARHDVFITGFGQSELDGIVQREAERLGRRAVANPSVEGGSFYRSDQFAFAQAGVPGLFMGPGTDAVAGGLEAGKAEQAPMRTLYHTPEDAFSEDWNFEALVQDSELHLAVVRVLADGNMWPRWREGSEFRELGEALRKQR
jgi:Zn-dependent M28 family amino/carboxypeptidase